MNKEPMTDPAASARHARYGTLPERIRFEDMTEETEAAPSVGATKPAHLEDAVAAVDLSLSPEEIAALEAPYRPHPVKGLR